MRVILIFFLTTTFVAAQEVQNLEVETIDGTEISLQELIHQGPVLINFWALWCEPCKLEMKQLQLLFEKQRDNGFAIVAVNQDNQKSVAKVSSYVSSHNFSFSIVLDPDGEIAQHFNVQNIPFSLLFDTDGKIVYKALGYKPGDEVRLENEIRKVLLQNHDK